MPKSRRSRSGGQQYSRNKIKYLPPFHHLNYGQSYQSGKLIEQIEDTYKPAGTQAASTSLRPRRVCCRIVCATIPNFSLPSSQYIELAMLVRESIHNLKNVPVGFPRLEATSYRSQKTPQTTPLPSSSTEIQQLENISSMLWTRQDSYRGTRHVRGTCQSR